MSNERWTTREKSILALCALAIILDGFDSQLIGFAAPSLLADWQITKGDLAPILGVGLFGMALGAAAGGNFADRYGRRKGMIASTALFGLATCAMAAAETLWQLGGLRLLAGLGLGGALPIAAATVAEFAPSGRRSLAVSISIICIPIGGMVGGLFAAPLLPVIGWRGLFVIAGLLPLFVAAALYFGLPESPSFLRARDERMRVPAKLQTRAAGNAELDDPAVGFFRMISEMGLRGDTAALCAAFAASLLGGYLYFNWLPVLLAESGFALSTTSVGLLVYNLGCVASGLAVGVLTTWTGTRLPLLLLAATGAMGSLALAHTPPDPDHPTWLMAALFMQGFCLGGVQVLLYALAVHVYPPEIRATGIGAAASIGRIGAISSSALGAVILATGAGAFFLAIAMAATVSGLCILMMRHHDRRDEKDAVSARPIDHDHDEEQHQPIGG